jgi:hypothetical protein
MSDAQIVEVTKRQGRVGFNTGRDVHGEPLDRTDFGRPITVYKAVRLATRRGQQRWVSEWATGQGRVVYEVGVPVVAPPWLRYYGYHLTAFDTLARAAADWQHYPKPSRRYHAVFEADGEGAVALPASAVLMGCNRNRLRMRPGFSGYWQKGTVMVRRLTLRRRIEVEEMARVLEGAPDAGAGSLKRG